MSGQPERMAPLSAAGPTADGRRKPDVCAPGTNLVGPRSSVATGRGWGLASPAPHYVVDGGTSAAVAAAAGATLERGPTRLVPGAHTSGLRRPSAGQQPRAGLAGPGCPDAGSSRSRASAKRRPSAGSAPRSRDPVGGRPLGGPHQ